MITRNKIVLGLSALSFLALQSCNKIKDFKDLNTNPNQTTSTIPSALLANVTANLGGNLVYDGGGLNTVCGLYTQYFAETQYTEVSTFVTKPSNNFDGYYSGPIEDLQNIIKYNSDPATAGDAAVYGSNNDQIAIARILRAQYVKFVTDAVGDVPYFDALKGNAGLVTPAYDKQQDIYADLVNELTQAVAQFDDGPTVQGDLIYNGSVSAWKKYANSLRLMLAINMVSVDKATATTDFQAALNDPAGVISSVSDNANLAYPGGVYLNPFYNYYNITQRFDYALSNTVTNILNATTDPRVNIYGSSGKGFPVGLSRDHALAYQSANSDWDDLIYGGNNNEFSQSTTPITIISAAYIDLIRAEGAEEGLSSEDPVALYKAGVQASFDQYGLGSATTFLGGSSVALTGGAGDLQKICTQEWLAAFPAGEEGWNTTRRTGFPAIVPGPDAVAGAGVSVPTIPSRFPYGVDDYTYNTSNVAIAAKRYAIGGTDDSQYAKIWWNQ